MLKNYNFLTAAGLSVIWDGLQSYFRALKKFDEREGCFGSALKPCETQIDPSLPPKIWNNKNFLEPKAELDHQQITARFKNSSNAISAHTRVNFVLIYFVVKFP